MKDLKENPTKAEELAFFESLCEHIPKGSYLSHLFTPALKNEVLEAIRKDLLPDVMDELKGTAEALAAKVKEAQEVRHGWDLAGMANAELEDKVSVLERNGKALVGELTMMREALEMTRYQSHALAAIVRGLTDGDPEKVAETMEEVRKIRLLGGVV